MLYAAVLAGSALLRRPALGYLVGALTGDLTGWRREPVLRRAYTLITWIFAAMFLLRLLVQVPLYLAGWVEALGAARLAMGIPLYVGTILLAYGIVQRAARARSRPREPARRHRGSLRRLAGSAAAVPARAPPRTAARRRPRAARPRSGAIDLAVAEDRDQRGVLAATGSARPGLPTYGESVGQRELDQVGVALPEGEQPHQVADA